MVLVGSGGGGGGRITQVVYLFPFDLSIFIPFFPHMRRSRWCTVPTFLVSYRV